MSKRNGSKQGEIADKVEGAANVAANLAKENAPEPEVTKGKRGRKPSTRMTPAKWNACVKAGQLPENITFVQSVIDENHRMIWGYVRYNDPVLTLSDNGDLQLSELRSNAKNQPEVIALKTVTAAEVLNWINSQQ
jgi:hypothetical protein